MQSKLMLFSSMGVVLLKEVVAILSRQPLESHITKEISLRLSLQGIFEGETFLICNP